MIHSFIRLLTVLLCVLQLCNTYKIEHDCAKAIPQEPCFKRDCWGRNRYGSKVGMNRLTFPMELVEDVWTSDDDFLDLRNISMGTDNVTTGVSDVNQYLKVLRSSNNMSSSSDSQGSNVQAYRVNDVEGSSHSLPFDKQCCRLTPVCYDTLKEIDRKYGPAEILNRYNHKEDFEKTWCCLRLNLWSCGDVKVYEVGHMPIPGTFNKSPKCSNPGSTFGE